MASKEMPDRRSGSERRGSKRFSVYVDVDWEHDGNRYSGTLSDVSETGCFVLGGADVSDGDQVKVFIPIGGGIKVEFAGEVRNHVFEIGFAVHFFDLSDAQKGVLGYFFEGKRGSIT